jgi:hypothetical protein
MPKAPPQAGLWRTSKKGRFSLYLSLIWAFWN